MTRMESRVAPARSVRGLVLVACGGDSSQLSSVGTLERDRIELVAESDDPIAEIAAREGESVAEGQLLLRLDPARVDAQVARAQAARDEAAARVAEAARGPRPGRIQEARARLAGARSGAETAQRELERVEALAKVDVASRSPRTRPPSRPTTRWPSTTAVGWSTWPRSSSQSPLPGSCLRVFRPRWSSTPRPGMPAELMKRFK